ncbi:MAG: MFS transporter [Alphaproteobacteria bacterium]
MIRALLPVAALLSSVALLLVGNGLQSTLLPVRGQAAGFDEVVLGVLGSAYFGGFVLGCLAGPWIVARAGHIRTFAAMVSLASSVVLAHALIVAPVPWWLLRAGTGVCFAVLFMVIESWLNEKASNQSRGVVFAAYLCITLVMITAGQLMLLFDRPDSVALYLAASILVSLAALPVALTRAEAPAPIVAARLDLNALYRTSPVGAVGCFTVGLTNGAFWSLAPVFAGALAPAGGVAVSDYVAWFMAVAVIAGAVGQFPLGRLSDVVDRRLVITGTALGGALTGLALTIAAVYAPALMLPAVFALGLFTFTLYSLAVAHVNDFVGREDFVQVAGGLLLLWAAGAVVGPLIASAVMRIFGPAMLFAFPATAHLAFAVFTVHRIRRRPAPAAAEKAAFVDAALVGQTVSTVDPLSPPAPAPGSRPGR